MGFNSGLFKEINMPSVDLARNQAFQNSALQDAVKTLGGAVTGLATDQRNQNTNGLLAQILGAQTGDDLSGIHQSIKDQLASNGQGADQLSVLNAFNQQRNALNENDQRNYNQQLQRSNLEDANKVASAVIGGAPLPTDLNNASNGLNAWEKQKDWALAQDKIARDTKQQETDNNFKERELTLNATGKAFGVIGDLSKTSDKGTTVMDPNTGQITSVPPANGFAKAGVTANGVLNSFGLGGGDASNSSTPNGVGSSNTKLGIPASIGTNYGSITSKYATDNVSQNMLHAVIAQESRGKNNLTSPAGAKGLMQIMPINYKSLNISDPFDAEQSIRGGAQFLNSLMTKYGNDASKALAAYNWGPANLDAYLKTGKGKNGQAIPAETLNYVTSVLGRMQGNSPQSTTPSGVGSANASTPNVNGIEVDADDLKKASYQIKNFTTKANLERANPADPNAKKASDRDFNEWAQKEGYISGQLSPSKYAWGGDAIRKANVYQQAMKNPEFAKASAENKKKYLTDASNTNQAVADAGSGGVLGALFTPAKALLSTFGGGGLSDAQISDRISTKIADDVNASKGKVIQADKDNYIKTVIEKANENPGVPVSAIGKQLSAKHWEKYGTKEQEDLINKARTVNNPF